MQRTFMATVSPLALALLATLGATHVSAAVPESSYIYQEKGQCVIGSPSHFYKEKASFPICKW